MSDGQAADGVISLPNGGGAVRGLGETFAPDLHTGTGNYAVPLSLPPGRNGFQPELALRYSTGQPDGPFGLGWSIGVPDIQRKTSAGVPRYRAGDVFLLAGAEDLVPVPGGTASAQRYRPQVEGLFARIVHHTEPGQDYWEVRTGDGRTSVYGTRRPDPAPPDWQDPATIADPDDSRRIFAWKLTRVVDVAGNAIEYDWARDAAQLYLREIRYADHGEPPATEFLVHVAFAYVARPDELSDRRAGFEVRTRWRCDRIETRVHHGAAPLHVRTVALDYHDETGTPAANGTSLLHRVRVEGHDGDRTESLPPLELEYSAFDPARRRYRSFTAPAGALPDGSLARSDTRLVDLFGNGLPSVLQLDGTARYWRNRGGGRLDRPRSVPHVPSDAFLGAPGVELADLDGDGRMDLLVADERRAGYYPLSFDGGFDPGGYVGYAEAPTFAFTDPNLRLVDLTGDGIPDVMRTGLGIELFMHDRRRGWGAPSVRARDGGETVPEVAFSDPQVQLADMTGDGLTDVVRIRQRGIEYWPSSGHGRWGAKVVMRNAPRLAAADDFDPARALLGDVDGDGRADLVYVADGHVTVWLNRAGAGWSEAIRVNATPRIADAAALRLADMNGTGTPGVLWTYDAGLQRESTYKFLDLVGGRKPYLLSRIDNHMGQAIAIDYAPSTRCYLDDEQSPSTRWRTTLPFPVNVVARVTVSDALLGITSTSEFRYHHGYYDGVSREFRGFARVDQRDATTIDRAGSVRYTPPTETRTWFHVGPVGGEDERWGELDLAGEHWAGDGSALAAIPAGDARIAALPPQARRQAVRALRGRVLRTELYALDGSERQSLPYTVTEHRHDPVLVLDGRSPDDPAIQARPIVVPRAVAERTTQWERGEDPFTRASFTGGHDAYGRPGLSVAIDVPRGRDYRVAGAQGEPYRATLTRTTYATRDDALLMTDRVTSTTTYEVAADASASLLDVARAALAADREETLLAQTLTWYDGAPFEGRPWGELGDHGLVARVEQLALTPAVLPSPPPYLTRDPVTWTDEYPEAFRATVPAAAGYVWHDAGSPSPAVAGWYAATARHRYDVQSAAAGRGLPTGSRDALGRETSVAYDEYGVLPVAVTDPATLVRSATYDYRTLKPALVTDPNGNRSAVAYTPLGFVASVAVMGRPGESTGDTPEQPGTSIRYRLHAFDESAPDARQPVWTETTRRLADRWTIVADENARRAAAGLPALGEPEREALLPADEATRYPERFLVRREYSDGAGRLLQTRTQADAVRFGSDPFAAAVGLPADPAAPVGDAEGRAAGAGSVTVVVSGWKVHDNKAQVVEAYEPFYADGWEYARPTPAQLGLSTRVFYDPRGQEVRSIGADGAETVVVHGVPGTCAAPVLSDPSRFEPTPWITYTYDANDNAARTHPAARSQAWRHHRDTPRSVLLDTTGEIAEIVERNRPAEEDRHVTRRRHDVRGNLVESYDPSGRRSLRVRYDHMARPWTTELLDAGETTTVLDAAGNPLERRDAKGALVLRAVDALGRPTRLWARDRAGQPVTLRETRLYAEDAESGVPDDEARSRNLIGREVLRYDEAGELAVTRCDARGRVLGYTRRALTTDFLLARLPPGPGDWSGLAAATNWQPPAGTSLSAHAESVLEPRRHEVTSSFDALGRRTRVIAPADATGHRAVLDIGYDHAGALTRVTLDGSPIVERIAYNARGQRALVALGNGTIVRYAYDRATSQLARMRAERGAQPTPLTYRGAGPVWQDCGYEYDLVGNVLAVHDRTPGGGAGPTPDRLDRAFTYDALYRLLEATGRECDLPAVPEPWAVDARCADVTRVRPYTERYRYDASGNLVDLRHDGRPGRELTPAADGNRLTEVKEGNARRAYEHDGCGNLTLEGTARRFEWDHANRLQTYRMQTPGAVPSRFAQYRYDSGGERVMRVVRDQGGNLEVTVAVGDGFEHATYVRGAAITANSTVEVRDGQRPLASVRVGPPAPDDATPARQLHLADHLDNVTVVLDDQGALVAREEFTPYGEVSFGGFGRKRYRLSGRPRDAETGLSYHGARYLAPWLGRWISCDPTGNRDGPNLYAYVRGSPTVNVDATGRSGAKPLQNYDQARAAANRGAAEFREGKDLPTEVQAGHLFEAKQAPAAGIDEELLNSEFVPLHSRKGQGYDATVTLPDGSVKTRTRHTLLDRELSPWVRELAIKGAGGFTEQSYKDAVAELQWRIQGTGVSWDEIQVMEGKKPVSTVLPGTAQSNVSRVATPADPADSVLVTPAMPADPKDSTTISPATPSPIPSIEIFTAPQRDPRSNILVTPNHGPIQSPPTTTPARPMDTSDLILTLIWINFRLYDPRPGLRAIATAPAPAPQPATGPTAQTTTATAGTMTMILGALALIGMFCGG
jgi:RHS repeat-associated protein